jgi:hypothetical protein
MMGFRLWMCLAVAIMAIPFWLLWPRPVQPVHVVKAVKPELCQVNH